MDPGFPPFHVAAADEADAGYNVRVQDPPDNVDELWGILHKADVPLPNVARWVGYGRILLTWADAVSAERAKLTLDRVVTSKGTPMSARFWTPEGYDPKVDDHRHAGTADR